MDVMDAISLLKKYNLYDSAQVECKNKKISTAPYDMQGHHDIYCKYLSKKWVEFRDKKIKFQEIKCKYLDVIPSGHKPAHDKCSFVEVTLFKELCSKSCEYYRDEIKPLYDAMNELREAESVLKDAAQRDYWLR